MSSGTRMLVNGAIRRTGRSSWFSLALLLGGLGSLAVGLSNTVRGLDLGLLLTLVVMGLLVGWSLGASSLPDWPTVPKYRFPT